MEDVLIFFHLVFVGFVALFPPVNPIGTALIGSWLFKLFGISLPVVQLAGGILICKMGWQFLSSDGSTNGGPKESQSGNTPERGTGEIDGILFYPLAFPMTTGAGTISVLLTLSAHAHSGQTSGGYAAYFLNLGSLFLAIILMCVAIYLSYAFTPALLRKLGARGEQIVNRLSAFGNYATSLNAPIILAKSI